MKKKLSLSALLIFAAAGLCAAVPVKPVKGNDPTIKSMIKFAQLPTKRGIEIKLAPDAPGKAVVLIYNWNNDVVWKDALSPKKGMDRAFILSMLDNGINDGIVADLTLNYFSIILDVENLTNPGKGFKYINQGRG